MVVGSATDDHGVELGDSKVGHTRADQPWTAMLAMGRIDVPG